MSPGGIELSSDNISGRSSRQFRSEWHHYAFVSTGNELLQYVDGMLVGKLVDKMSNTTSRASISCYDSNYLDEVRVSMRARSVDEIFSYVQYAKDKLPK